MLQTRVSVSRQASIDETVARRFSDRLEAEVITLAADRYFQKAVDVRTGLPKPNVYSPVGMFYDAYAEALVEWGAIEYKRRLNNGYVKKNEVIENST